MPKIFWGLSASAVSALDCHGEWCKLGVSVEGSILPVPHEYQQHLGECLDGCQLEPLCLHATFDSKTCGWIGRPGIPDLDPVQQPNDPYWFVQTQQQSRVPNRYKDGSLEKIPLGDGPLTLAQCKAAFAQAYLAGTVMSVGEWDGTSGESTKENFAIADAANGKGAREVIVKYSVKANLASSNLTGDHESGCKSGGDTYVVDHDSNDNVYLKEWTKSTLDGAPVWTWEGDNISPLHINKCIAKTDLTPSIKSDQKAHLWEMEGDTPCTATSSLGTDVYWQFKFHGNLFKNDPFAMGKCGANDYIPIHYMGSNPICKSSTCVDKEDPSDPCKVVCGKYSMQLSKPGASLWTRRHGDDAHNCFGFTSTTTTPPPTTSHPPSPAPSTCDFCKTAGLDCCGEGIHAFCYNPEYNQCCEVIDEPYEVKVACALGQECHPGCLPHGWETAALNSPVAEANTSVLAVSEPVASEQVSGAALDICHGTGLAFAVCTAGTKCCGRHTSLDPACYYEEWNECCQPPGSEFSVICAKGQGCAQTDNGVPFCVDSFEACRACGDQFDAPFNTYLCHEYGSDTCHRASDPTACKEVFGESATFCWGMYDAEEKGTELQFV